MLQLLTCSKLEAQIWIQSHLTIGMFLTNFFIKKVEENKMKSFSVKVENNSVCTVLNFNPFPPAQNLADPNEVRYSKSVDQKLKKWKIKNKWLIDPQQEPIWFQRN